MATKHQGKAHTLSEDEGKEPEFIHRRTRGINYDNNVEVILAGRTSKVSIDIPEEPKYSNQRMQKIIIESENEFTHLLGEVNGNTYRIRGRPELALITIGYPPTPELKLLPKPLTVTKLEGEEDDASDVEKKEQIPVKIADMQLLYNTAKTYFLMSPKVEDRILAHLKDYPAYEVVIKDAWFYYGEHEQRILDPKLHRLWRRFLREFMYPELMEVSRMQLMEDRLNFEIPYTDDVVMESEPEPLSSSSEEDEKVKKKKGRRKKAGAKKVKAEGSTDKPSARVTTAVTASAKHTTVQTGPSTSARVTQRMSTKKGIGLLAKRTTARGDVK